MRSFILLTLLAVSPPSTLVQGSAESIILQTVLSDARAKWQGSPVPCVSDFLKTFGKPQDTEVRLSNTLGGKLPFAICHTNESKPHFEISAPMLRAGSAFVEFDYICATCGHGSIYTLRKIENRWSVVDRTPSWVS